MATLINVDETMTEVFPNNPPGFSLEEVQALVGGYVELVSRTIHMGSRMMLVDEEGLMKELPFNEKASQIARRPIVGPALMVSNEEFN